MKDKFNSSNRLYSGLVRDLYEAVNLVQAECNEEMVIEANEDDKKLNASLLDFQRAARAALVIYDKRVSPAMRAAAAEMKASSNEDVRRFGEALESGDYTGLAI